MNLPSLIRLLESAAAPDKTFGCAMLAASGSFAEAWPAHCRGVVDEADLADDGFEDDPHVTVLFGLHEEEVQATEVQEVLATTSPLRVMVEEISLFENDEYDVVKYTIPQEKELLRLREQLLEFPSTVTFPDYCPHMTIAYVKKGCGKKYAGKLEKPFEVVFDTAVYSFHKEPGNKESREQNRIPLGGSGT